MLYNVNKTFIEKLRFPSLIFPQVSKENSCKTQTYY